MPSDSDLLRQYADDRSEAAFAELVRRHIDLVYGVALRHARTAHRAEDAAQAVFTALARKAGALARRRDIVGWLYLSARYAATKIVRSEVRRERREREAGMNAASTAPETPAVDWGEIQPLLDDALEDLGEKDRSAVLLRCVKSLSFAEVGAALQLSEEASRKRVERALERLRGALVRRGIASTATAVALALADQAAVAAPATLAASVSSAAVAAGGSLPLLGGVLHLMSTSKITASAAILAGALAITAAWHETRAAQGAGAALAALTRSNDALTAQVAAAQAGARAAEKDTAALAQDLAALHVAGAAPAAAAASGPRDPARAAALRAAGTDYLRTGVKMDLLAYAKFLKLSPQEIDALADIEARTRNTVVNGVVVPGNPPEAVRAGRREIVNLLGLDGALQLGAEARVLPYQKMTAELAGDLGTEAPIAGPAAGQLTTILQENHVDTEPAAWPTAIAAAGGILSPAQVAALKTYAASKTGIDYAGGAAP